MSENQPDKRAEYERLKKQLKEAVNKKKEYDQQVSRLEEDIFNKETKYLSDGSNHGNLIKGFDNFMKSSSSSASRNRKIHFTDEDRIFSLSSSTYVRHLKKQKGEGSSGLNTSVTLEDDLDDVDSEGGGSSNTSRKKR